MRAYDDVFICFAWYQDCVINWNALEAIGTLGAVFAAFFIWFLDRGQRKKSENAKKVSAALTYLPIVDDWIETLDSVISKASLPAVAPDSRARVVAFSGSLEPPASLMIHVASLSDLEDVGAALGHRMIAIADIGRMRKDLEREADCKENPTDKEHNKAFTQRALGWIELVQKQRATLAIIAQKLRSIAHGKL